MFKLHVTTADFFARALNFDTRIFVSKRENDEVTENDSASICHDLFKGDVKRVENIAEHFFF